MLPYLQRFDLNADEVRELLIPRHSAIPYVARIRSAPLEPFF